MRKMLLFLLIPLFFISCDNNRIKIETDIKPELQKVGLNTIAVQYSLGNLLILDEWTGLNAGQILYLTKNGKRKTVHLKVNCGDFFEEAYFIYSIGNIEITTKPVKWKALEAYIESFPNVVWEIKNGVYLSEDEKETSNEPKNKKLEDL